MEDKEHQALQCGAMMGGPACCLNTEAYTARWRLPAFTVAQHACKHYPAFVMRKPLNGSEIQSSPNSASPCLKHRGKERDDADGALRSGRRVVECEEAQEHLRTHVARATTLDRWRRVQNVSDTFHLTQGQATWAVDSKEAKQGRRKDSGQVLLAQPTATCQQQE